MGPFGCPCDSTVYVELCADCEYAIDESNETNNCLAIELECPPCGPTASYGKNVHSQGNVLSAQGALGEPDNRGAFMYRDAKTAIKLEDTIPNCEKVSVWIRRVAGQAQKFTVEVSSDGKSWAEIGTETCTFSGWTQYDINGNWDNVKYIRITKPGSSSRGWWQQLKLMEAVPQKSQSITAKKYTHPPTKPKTQSTGTSREVQRITLNSSHLSYLTRYQTDNFT